MIGSFIIAVLGYSLALMMFLAPLLTGPGAKRSWREVLELSNIPLVNISSATIANSFRHLASKRHPDAGGSHDAMAELNRARDEALKEIGNG
jgi:hypothetical protein